MKTTPKSALPNRSEVARAVATLRSDPGLIGMKLRQRWNQRKQQVAPAPGAPQRPKVASIDQDLDTVVAQLRRRTVGRGIVYGEAGFRDSLLAAAPEVTWTWVSHRDADLLAGASLPSPADAATADVVVVGGADVKTEYLNALRWMERSGEVKPVLWVGQNFEYCGSTLPIPAEVDAGEIYLFHHFSDFFPIKDPLLVRVTSTDRRNHHERYLLMRPQETVHFSLDELLPDREGTAFVEVRTTHPALTGNRHPRWRVWADLFWKGSLTSLHGAHDYGPDHVCESRIPLSEFESGSLVLTLPNYDHRLSDSDSAVRWAESGAKGTYERDPSAAIDQITIAAKAGDDEKSGFWGYRYQGHGTSYWFAFEQAGDQARGFLRGNHEVTVAQVEYRPPLTAERRTFLEGMEERGFLFWPHALPLLEASSEIEFGFSFEAANPQVSNFVVIAFDGQGQVLNRRTLSLPNQGYHYAEELLAGLDLASGQRPELLLISPDWKTMKVDPQQMKAIGNLVIRNKRTGDRDITEFQSCWRNLNATVDGFPHWLHPSKGVIGRTNVLGHVRTAGGLRTGILTANGAGNLSHATEAIVKVRLHAPSGAVRSSQVALPAFTSKVLWVDELFPGIDEFLGAGGYGAALVSSADADVNCQILTCSTAGSVSLQHLWGY
jgi:hypothetical protein